MGSVDVSRICGECVVTISWFIQRKVKYLRLSTSVQDVNGDVPFINSLLDLTVVGIGIIQHAVSDTK